MVTFGFIRLWHAKKIIVRIEIIFNNHYHTYAQYSLCSGPGITSGEIFSLGSL